MELTHKGSVSCREGFIGVCYALHAIVATAAAKNAYEVQSTLDQQDDAVMV